jgi:hypothetical protein
MHEDPSQEAVSEPSREGPREGEWLSYAELGRVRGIGRESAKKLALREGWRRIPGNDGSARVMVPREWLKPAREPSREHAREESREDGYAINALQTAFTTALAAKDSEIASMRGQLEGAAADRRAAEARADAAVTRAEIADADRRAAEMRAEAERARAKELDQKLAAEWTRGDKAERSADQFKAAAQEALLAAETADRDRRVAEVARDEERARVDGLGGLLEATQLELAEQRALTDQADAARQEAAQAADELRRANEARKARGRLRRAWDGWRGR